MTAPKEQGAAGASPPPFEPSDALVEQVAGYFSGALPYLSAVTHRNLAVSVLRVCGPAIIDEGIRARLATKPVFAVKMVHMGGEGVYGSLEVGDVLRALGVAQ